MMPRPLLRQMVLGAALLLAASPASRASEQDAAPKPRYAGVAVIDVLQDLNARGLRVVFSTRLVRPTLRVAEEPAGPTLHDILRQVLQPHGLEARPRANGVLVVARAPRRSRTPELPPPAAETLRGRVIDAVTEQPLADVLVVAPASGRQTRTDGGGRFELTELDTGRWPLYVSLIGYVLARPEVTIPTEGAAEVLVLLTPGSGAYTEQLIVHAEQGPRPVAPPSSFTVRSADLQELRGVLADDPWRALQTVPGVATGDDFRSEFSIRGSAFRQIGVTLDGIPTPWLVHGVRAVEDTGTITMINADVLDDVTVTAGAAPQRHGNRTGAWLHAAVREGSRDAVRMTGSLSGTGASMVIEGPLGGERRGAWLVSARQSYIDWLLRRLERDEETTFGFSDVQAKLVFDLTPRHQFQLTTVAGRSRLHEIEDSPSPNGTTIGRASTALGIAAWRATLGSALVLTQRTAVAGLRYRNTNAFGQNTAEGREWFWTYRSEAAYAARPWWLIEADLSVDREWTTAAAHQYRGVAGGEPALHAWSAGDRQRWRHGGSVGSRLTPVSALAIDAGLRSDRETFFDHATLSPWVLGSWTLTPRFRLAAGIAGAHQQPDLSQLPSEGHFGELDAERSRHGDVSAEYALTPHLQLEASIFQRREWAGLRFDAPEPRLVNGLPALPFASRRWGNALEVTARGVEVFLRRSAPRGAVGWISYAYGRTRTTDTLIGARYWADFDQRHLLNVHASHRLGSRTNVSARFRYGSNMPVPGFFAEQDGRLVLASARNELRLPAYARLDLRMNRTYHFTRRRLTLFAEVLNVLNRENVGRADGTVRSDATVDGFVEKLFPLLPSAGIRIDF